MNVGFVNIVPSVFKMVTLDFWPAMNEPSIFYTNKFKILHGFRRHFAKTLKYIETLIYFG